MRKILAVILFCIMTVSFSSCVTFSYPLDIETKPEDVTSIEVYYFAEIVDWNWNEKKWMGREKNSAGETIYDEDGHFIYYEYECEPIAYVQESDYARFIEEAEALPFKNTVFIGAAMDPAWYYSGYVVKINSGEEYEFVVCSAGGSLRWIEEETWKEFLKGFIGEEVFGSFENA